MKEILPGEIESTFLYSCIFLLKKMYLLSSHYAAGMLYELRPQLTIGKFCRIATLATCLAWVRSDQENTDSVDNVGLG